MSVSDLLILCKYLLSGKWLLHICRIMLECRLVSVYNFLRSELKWNASPNCATLGILGEAFQRVAHLVLSLSEYSCFVADALVGRGFLSRCGRLALTLDHPEAASLASLSASSFPLTLLWPEIHLMDKLQLAQLAASWMVLSMYCPGEALRDASARMLAWLSV